MNHIQTSPLLRSLIRELRHTNNSHKSLHESPVYQYVIKQYRKNQVTTEQVCKAQEETRFMADAYLCYLRSTRRAAELRKEYHGRGERSIEETCRIVGFKGPQEPK